MTQFCDGHGQPWSAIMLIKCRYSIDNADVIIEAKEMHFPLTLINRLNAAKFDVFNFRIVSFNHKGLCLHFIYASFYLGKTVYRHEISWNFFFFMSDCWKSHVAAQISTQYRCARDVPNKSLIVLYLNIHVGHNKNQCIQI